MMHIIQPEAATGPPTMAGLGQFFEHVRYTNPFDVNRVVQSSLGEVDVEKVHHAQFAQLVDLARRAHAQAVASWPGVPGSSPSCLRGSCGSSAFAGRPTSRPDV